jgi:hypothetical protein
MYLPLNIYVSPLKHVLSPFITYLYQFPFTELVTFQILISVIWFKAAVIKTLCSLNISWQNWIRGHIQMNFLMWIGGCHGRDRMVVAFTTTCGISAYHHKRCEFEPRSWRSVLDSTLCDKVVSDLRQFSGFLQVPWFPPTIKLTATMPITTNVLSSNPVHGKVYSIQHYVIKL